MFWKTSSQLFCSLAWCWGSSEAGHLLGSTSQSSVEAQRRRTTCPAVQHSQMGQDHDHQDCYTQPQTLSPTTPETRNISGSPQFSPESEHPEGTTYYQNPGYPDSQISPGVP